MKGKKTSKILVPILMASIAGTIVSGNVRDTKVYAAGAPLLSTEVSMSGFKRTGKVGEEYTLPVVTVDTGYTAEMELTDPRGASLKTYNDNGVLKNIDTVFTPAHSGTYTLRYKIMKGTELVSTTDTMKIEVSSSDYSIKMPTNSPYVILDTVKTGTTIRIPAPELLKDGETDTLDHLYVTVTDERGQTSPRLELKANSYYEYTVTTAGTHDIEYKYEDAGHAQVTRSQRFQAKDNYDYSKIKLSMDWSSTRPTTGQIGLDVKLPKVSVVDTNNGSSSINAHVDIDVFYLGTPTNRLATPEAVEVGDYSFVPTKAGDYSVKYQARITYYDESGEHKVESVVRSWTIEDIKDSTDPEPLVVNDYKVNSDGKITEIASSYATGADGKVTATYTAVPQGATEEEILELLGSRSNAIPSVAIIPTGESKVKVAIPAIYGTDNAHASGTSLVYTRSVRDEFANLTTVNKGFDMTTTVSDGETAYHEFTAPGTYTIRYKAADGTLATDNNEAISFSIEVVNEADYTKTTPKVTLQNFSEYTYTDTNLVFNKPTFADSDDARIDVVTTYQLTAGAIKSAEYTLDDSFVNDDGKYELDITDLITKAVASDTNFTNNSIASTQVTKITISASATNDVGNTGKATRVIELINTLDNTIPEVDGATDFNTEIVSLNSVSDLRSFKQRTRVQLPEVYFTDTDDSVITSNVTVTDPNGNNVVVYNGYSTFVSGDLTMKNGYFTPEYAGVYNIKYTVKDSGGNAVYAFYQIEVELTETPELYLANISEFENTEKQLGSEIAPPKAGLYVNGEYLTPDDSNEDILVETSWEIAPLKWADVRDEIVPAGATPEEEAEYRETWELENRTQLPEVTQVNGKNISFTAYVPGVYTIRYSGSYTTNPGTLDEETFVVENERIVRVTVKDLTKPTITIDGNQDTFSHYVNEYEAGKERIIPGFNVGGSYDISNVKRSVKVTGHNGKEITATYIKALEEYTETEITELVTAATPSIPGEEPSAYATRLEAAIAEFREYHTVNAGKYSFIPSGNGTHTIYYIAVDANGNETKSEACYVYVGDCEAPVIDFGTTEVQESVIPSTVKVGTDFELNMSELVKYISDNKSNIADGTLKITATLKDSSGAKQENLFGTDSTRYKWNLDVSGNYKLSIKVTDNAGKTTTKDFTIEVKADESKETKVKEVVGTILVVLSVAILAGVIVYFVVTGRKLRPGAKKGKKTRVSKK